MAYEKSKCPMTVTLCEKYNITDAEQEKFCNKGCSIECGKFLKEHLEKTRKIEIVEV